MSLIVIGLFVGSPVVVAACGGGKRDVTQDVIGTWAVDNSTGDRAITMTHGPDGSFTQSAMDKDNGRLMKQPGAVGTCGTTTSPSTTTCQSGGSSPLRCPGT
jgi:hypothetical protein